MADLNEALRKHRGYVVRDLKEGEAVVTCMSGGLDSIANIAVLLDVLKLRVYPFFIERGQRNLKYELESVDFFDKFFHQRYPDLYNNVVKIKLNIPPKEYKKELREVQEFKDEEIRRSRASYPARNPIIFLVGMEYAYSLEAKGIKVDTIIAAFHCDDNAYHSSLTSVRIQNLLMCDITGDWDLQFISIPIEIEYKNYYGKEVMLKVADRLGIPLEKTRSCVLDSEIQCGVCTMACKDRRLAFKKAGIKDKTTYLHPFPDDDDKGWVIVK